MSRSASGQWRLPQELVSLRERLADVFDAGGGVETEQTDATEAALRWMPAVDVISNAEAVVVSMEATGVQPSALSIDLAAEELTIRGERRRVAGGARFHRIERAMGVFERSVALDGPVDIERAEARLEMGVLTVRVPRTTEAVAGIRRIEVVG